MGWSIRAIFPIWNLLTGVIMFYQSAIEENGVTDDNASLFEVFVSTILIIEMFLIIKLVFQPTWAMIFSICLTITSIFTFIISWSVMRIRSFVQRIK
jgi:hypothetical protein